MEEKAIALSSDTILRAASSRLLRDHTFQLDSTLIGDRKVGETLSTLLSQYFDLQLNLISPSLQGSITMARPQEVIVSKIGLTVLNPELSPDQASVEYVSQPYDTSVLNLAVLSSSTVWVDTRKEHGLIKAQTEIHSCTSHKRR